ncbi:nitrilase-related carbon-nitrogen hydrolase [Peredibacter sp. HCB2-198]|uniref:nitrilase-related carbon-nitrogen hydrolase n=1 Tax=Peredibacter sp. HCB2-198 TaxID=3383025 RepID=UPI0038B63C36
MKISVISYSLSHDPESILEWKSKLLGEIEKCVLSGAEVILYPEFFLMGLGKYFPSLDPKDQIEKVADYVAQDLLPDVKKHLYQKDVLVVLGSAPRKADNKVFNSSPVLLHGEWLFQDKLYLTPWETDFTPGEELRVFEFKGLKTAVVICFDSEQPDLAVKLKEEVVDLVLVPSATTNKNGSQRVNRCASARSVELGAAVVTALLIGDSVVELIDHNEGRSGLFLPAQEDITVEQETYSEYSTSKHIVAQHELNIPMLKKLKERNSETKPFHERIKTQLRLSRR